MNDTIAYEVELFEYFVVCDWTLQDFYHPKIDKQESLDTIKPVLYLEKEVIIHNKKKVNFEYFKGILEKIDLKQKTKNWLLRYYSKFIKSDENYLIDIYNEVLDLRQIFYKYDYQELISFLKILYCYCPINFEFDQFLKSNVINSGLHIFQTLIIPSWVFENSELIEDIFILFKVTIVVRMEIVFAGLPNKLLDLRSKMNWRISYFYKYLNLYFKPQVTFIYCYIDCLLRCGSRNFSLINCIYTTDHWNNDFVNYFEDIHIVENSNLQEHGKRLNMYSNLKVFYYKYDDPSLYSNKSLTDMFNNLILPKNYDKPDDYFINFDVQNSHETVFAGEKFLKYNFEFSQVQFFSVSNYNCNTLIFSQCIKMIEIKNSSIKNIIINTNSSHYLEVEKISILNTTNTKLTLDITSILDILEKIISYQKIPINLEIINYTLIDTTLEDIENINNSFRFKTLIKYLNLLTQKKLINYLDLNFTNYSCKELDKLKLNVKNKHLRNISDVLPYVVFNEELRQTFDI
jgi:hypothetical protein